MEVWIAVLNFRGSLENALVETAPTEEGIVAKIREWTRGEQRGRKFYDVNGTVVAFYVRRLVDGGTI